MSTRVPRQENGSEGFLEGKLLIALPGMPDPRFERSVIFMCAHSGEGAMGIIINKAVEGLSFHEMMEKLNIDVTARSAPGAALSCIRASSKAKIRPCL